MLLLSVSQSISLLRTRQHNRTQQEVMRRASSVLKGTVKQLPEVYFWGLAWPGVTLEKAGWTKTGRVYV